MRSSRIIKTLFWLRSPFGGPKGLALSLDGLLKRGFISLGEEPGEEIVLGLVARPWQLSGDIQRISPELFAGFAEPGYAKIGWNFRVEPSQDACVLSTETRVSFNDEQSLRKFRLYWLVVGPFSGLIRRQMLRNIRRDAEHAVERGS